MIQAKENPSPRRTQSRTKENLKRISFAPLHVFRLPPAPRTARAVQDGQKPLFALLILILASLACNAAMGGKPTPEPSPVSVKLTSTPLALPSPTPVPTSKVETSATETPVAEAAADSTLEHHWASRSFSEPETSADPDMANGKPDVTNCADPFLPTWAPPTSDQPQGLTLTYATPLLPSQVNIFLVGNPQEILRIEVVNSLTKLGKLIYDREQPGVSLPGGEKCPATFSIPASTEFEVDTVIIHTAASQTPLQIDAVELVGELRGYIELPVFWRAPLPGAPISLAAGQNGLVYIVTDPDGYANYADPARDELYAYDVEGNQLKKISIPAGSDLKDVAADPFGNLVIIDGISDKFVILSPEGKQLTTGGEDPFSQAVVSPQDGNLYLLMSSIIFVYTTDTAELVREMWLDDLHSYTGLAFDPLGALYTIRDADWDPTWMQLSPSTGNEMNAMPLKSSSIVDNVARDLAVDANGNFYILFGLNTSDIAVHMLDPNGYFLRRFGKLDYDTEPTPEGSFFEPRTIAVSPDGRFIFIADGREGDYHLTAFLLEPEQ